MRPTAERVTKEIWFDLTQAETIERAKDAARIRSEKIGQEEELKDHTKTAKRQIEKLEVQIGKLMTAVRLGKEERMVPCEIRRNFESKMMEFWYDGRIVESRPMDAAERQMMFDVVQGGAEGRN